jgi:hypothetical protein
MSLEIGTSALLQLQPFLAKFPQGDWHAPSLRNCVYQQPFSIILILRWPQVWCFAGTTFARAETMALSATVRQTAEA